MYIPFQNGQLLENYLHINVHSTKRMKETIVSFFWCILMTEGMLYCMLCLISRLTFKTGEIIHAVVSVSTR